MNISTELFLENIEEQISIDECTNILNENLYYKKLDDELLKNKIYFLESSKERNELIRLQNKELKDLIRIS